MQDIATRHTRGQYNHPLTLDAVDDHVTAYAYEHMKHDPHAFPVELAYLHFKHETMAQYHDILATGLTVEFFDGEDVLTPYPGSGYMLTDIRAGHLWTLATSLTQGFPIDHPMLELIDGRPLNDYFRAVHDINGHFATESSFGPNGERTAWRNHRTFYTREALPALWCETRGQAAWTNAYGDHASLPLRSRPFATQKAGTPPKKFV